jgi:hypothetical protein
VRAGRGSTAPFIGRAREGEASWAAGTALRAKERADRAEWYVHAQVVTRRCWVLGRRTQGPWVGLL